jgi:hypothetical protein
MPAFPGPPLADASPEAWLAYADFLQEEGRPEADWLQALRFAEGLRRRPRLVAVLIQCRIRLIRDIKEVNLGMRRPCIAGRHTDTLKRRGNGATGEGTTMNTDRWETCDDARRMLKGSRGRISDRKLTCVRSREGRCRQQAAANKVRMLG